MGGIHSEIREQLYLVAVTELAYASFTITVWWLVLRAYQILHETAEGKAEFQHQQFSNGDSITYVGSPTGSLRLKFVKEPKPTVVIGVDSPTGPEQV